MRTQFVKFLGRNLENVLTQKIVYFTDLIGSIIYSFFCFSLIYLLSSLKLLGYGFLADNSWQNYEFSVFIANTPCLAWRVTSISWAIKILNIRFVWKEGVAEGLQLFRNFSSLFSFSNDLLDWLSTVIVSVEKVYL